ncbi:MAG: hypothetical protein IJP01_06955, partial [Oscillospiraceae bacterium]|nr:hypothetical protein [Oscillospiraceae bacterium]
MRKLRVPYFGVNPKSYVYGDQVLAIAKHADMLAEKYDIDVMFTAQLIDIPRIKKAFPNALFRVGEGHFDDGSFLHPSCRPSIETCIQKHLSLIGSVENAFSETTTYP